MTIWSAERPDSRWRGRSIMLLGLALGLVVLIGCRGNAPVETGGDAGVPVDATARPVEPSSTPAATSPANVETSPTAVAASSDAGATGRIAFSGLDGGIYLVAADGTDLQLLIAPAGPRDSIGFSGAYAWPVWSPDGQTILYSALLPDGRQGLDVSLRTVPAVGGAEFLVYQDDPATAGIGSGVAHYAYWSPDSRLIALIAGTATGLTGEVVDAKSGRRHATLADEAPMYFSWSPDSRRMLVHHRELLQLYEFDGDGAPVGQPRQIGSGSLDYYAPTFSPRGDRLLYADSTPGGTGVFAGRFDDSPPTLLMEAPGRIAFGWAPDGRRVALLSDEVDGLFNRLTVLTSGGSKVFEIARGALISFWWSPDATRLALTSVGQDRAGNHVVEVTVIDVRDQSEAKVAALRPSDDFLFMQLFFDQFAHSMRIWSPDSRYLLIFGALGGPIGQSAAFASQEADERAQGWVVDTTGGNEPAQIGSGYIGSWSPR